MGQLQKFLVVGEVMIVAVVTALTLGVSCSHDYGDALSKSILFFEGQRSGRLPSTQRLTWRKDSALYDGFPFGVDLVGGYYDAGDNVKFNFPMAFSTTMLAWSVLEFGDSMGPDLQHALEAVQWATDYFLKATSFPGFVFVQVGDPYSDHACWERPEDMDTLRTTYAVSEKFPGSEVSGEIASALAASAIVFKSRSPAYSATLLKRAQKVFQFADTYRGFYNDSLGQWVCPFYCDFNGYEDELVWAAAWLYKATNGPDYWSYVMRNINLLEMNTHDVYEFGWDAKHAGVNVLVSKIVLATSSQLHPCVTYADNFVCNVLPESPNATVKYSPGGLLFKPGGSNMQHATALSFLLLTYAGYLNQYARKISCGSVTVSPARLVQFAKGQVDYILGTNPLNMSYMVGYGDNFPRRIHHRGSSVPSVDAHPTPMDCETGTTYYESSNPNPNLLLGAVVGGPDMQDAYNDSRADFVHSEPTTYINAPLVGLLAYFRSNRTSYRKFGILET